MTTGLVVRQAQRRLTWALGVAVGVAAAAACSSAGGTASGGQAGGGGVGQGGNGAQGGTIGEAGAGGEAGAENGGTGEAAGSDEPGGSAQGGAGSVGEGGASPGGAGGALSGGSGGDPFGGAGGMGPTKLLTITPVDAVFSPPSGVALAAPYKALLKESGKPTLDVTGQAVFTVEPASFGSFAGPTLKAPAGQLGQATVHCEAQGLKTSTSVKIEAGQVVIGPGAGADAPGKFGGAQDGGAISVVYPPSGTLVPPNMNSLEVHFLPAAGQELFELTFSSSTVSYTVYTGCQKLGGGCVYTPSASFWQQMANGARGNAPVSYRVRGVDGAGKVGTSAPRTIQFAAEDLEGGIYYWNAAGTILRYDFGLPTKGAEVYMTAPEAKGVTCVGCHTISRNGQRIAVGVDIPAPAPYRVFDVGTKTLTYPPPKYGSNFFAFNPDASQILVSDGTKISWLDANSGAVLGNAVVPLGTMPDWSPDGASLVYAKPSKAPPFGVPAPGVDSASLEVRPFGGAGFGPPSTLVPFAGANNYYPSYSPDGEWVVFNRSPSNRNSFANASADDAGLPDGEVWVVSAKGGTPVRLDAATLAGDSWPKWAIQTSSYEAGKVMWLTFSSRRAYGLRLAEGKTSQLWMVGFDPARAAAGQDPSFAAFWLPFQNLSSGNHIAQWVVKVERKPCASPADCAAGQTCGPSQQCVPL